MLRRIYYSIIVTAEISCAGTPALKRDKETQNTVTFMLCYKQQVPRRRIM